ncbi:MAG TPA: hypothetical protein P5572_20070, partial [Phycisphaerae bacterium]|nr:hypothetical protein [Phycisphaerae bacterium]
CPTDPEKTSPGTTGCNVAAGGDTPTSNDGGNDGTNGDSTDPNNDQFLTLEDAPACGAGAVGFVLVSFIGLGLISRRRVW